MRISDWSSDVCSSDLGAGCPLGKSRRLRGPGAQHRARRRGVLSWRQVSLHKQRKVARAVTARKLLKLLMFLSPNCTQTLTALEPPHQRPAEAERRLAAPLIDHNPAEQHAAHVSTVAHPLP